MHITAHVVDIGDIREVRFRIVRIRKDIVRMAEQYGVDAGHLCQIPTRIFQLRRVRRRADSAVVDGDHDVGTGLLQFRQIFLRGFDHAHHRHLAVEIAFVPIHDARRREAE